MKREAFVMKLKPGSLAEYKKRHDAIWPELVRAHIDSGIRDYSIFIAPDQVTLFAVRKLTDNESTADMPAMAIIKKWWAYNADLMEVYPDNAPKCEVLTEIFRME